MSDSKGAAIDELGDILYGIAEECGVINYDISAPKQAILAILAQEVNKARIDELCLLRKNSLAARSASYSVNGWVSERLTQLERLG